MAYTEIKEVNGKKYYYRAKSVREGSMVKKERIYLGADLTKDAVSKKEKEADKELMVLSSLLSEKELKTLAKIKEEYAKQPKGNLESKYEAFCSLFTYNSTAIEGNTLTLQETAQLLFERTVPASKSLREINEAINHKEAFDIIINAQENISKKFVLKLHKIVIKNAISQELEGQIGRYRTIQVYIRGVEWLPTKPKDVPKEMKALLSWYSKKKDELHPLITAAYFHSAFEMIHPFVDGNGRVGRLLMNFILRRNGYPMINILNSKKSEYYKALQAAQEQGRLRPFIEFLLSLLKEEKIKF